MKNLQIFNYNNNEIRTVIRNGEAWFVAKDVCDALGLTNSREALRTLDEDELVSVRVTSGGQNREMNGINESSLYSLIFKSNKPQAKDFRRWVTHKVLPDIRKHGMYLSNKVMNEAQNNPEAFKQLLEKYTQEKAKNQALQAKIDEEAPYATLGKVVVALPGSVPVADAAQFLRQHGVNIGQNGVYKYGRNTGLLSVQKKRWNKPTQKGIDSGIVNLELGQNGEYTLSTRTMITANGLKNLFNALFSEEYPLAALIEQSEEDDTE